ncbi:hypothetical protein HDU76_013605 [Blyttiomyces sp. JEL0837]|nr:hypothetical protein HDU76_013605 [Blyttiomyces sp. JEL0837]
MSVPCVNAIEYVSQQPDVAEIYGDDLILFLSGPFQVCRDVMVTVRAAERVARVCPQVVVGGGSKGGDGDGEYNFALQNATEFKERVDSVCGVGFLERGVLEVDGDDFRDLDNFGDVRPLYYV